MLFIIYKLIKFYEVYSILRMRQNRKNWSHQEDQAIANLVKKYGTKRWTLISQKMRERFPQDGRSGKQCRQRWHNHLSPIINKQPWTQEEIKLVFDSHRKFGNRWTQISQLLEGRTDNAVKNQFYSTLRKGLRRICKILGTRNSTTRIKKIKPTALSSLISNITEIPLGKGDNEQELYDMLFEFSNENKYDELKEKAVNEKYRQKMERLLEKILDSKDFIGKKKSKPRVEKHNTNQQNKQEKNIKQQQIKIEPQKPSEKEIKSMQLPQEEQHKFEFNLILDSEEEPNQNYFQFHGSSNMPGSHSYLMYDEGDFKSEKQISLKKQNSQMDPTKEEHLIPMKKKSSQNDKAKNLSQFEIENNNENLCKGFLSKSPNFTSKFKMPTPRIQQNPHTFSMISYGEDYIPKTAEQAQKQYNDYFQQIRNKVGARIERERFR